MNLLGRMVLLALIGLSGSAWADPEVRVVGLFSNAAVVNIDGQRHMLRAGRPAVQGVELVTADSRTATLRINGRERVLGLQRDYSEGFAEPERQSVSIGRSQGGHFRTTGSINGHSVQFMVDTGATSVALNSRQAARMGLDYRSGTMVQATTASGNVPGYLVTLNRVRIGEIELTQVEGLVLEGGFPTEVLLGNSFLSRLRMEDRGSVLILERRY
ncbi:retropepsin-like aspartic protease family protein [Halopseudomonas salegens]|uniref:Aspartyl protease family protein n=1 Tax=Halopseudomonas salegens TaxID=1434072 RepID=A0A1H2EHJ7_9GAMM|nr:TIGR02281 family clan AA aspartic protease [Halopseudomonas salegens]SDT94551.1 aspartyl protease family protein [Halopseudomonas salegens]